LGNVEISLSINTVWSKVHGLFLLGICLMTCLINYQVLTLSLTVTCSDKIHIAVSGFVER